MTDVIVSRWSSKVTSRSQISVCVYVCACNSSVMLSSMALMAPMAPMELCNIAMLLCVPPIRYYPQSQLSLTLAILSLRAGVAYTMVAPAVPRKGHERHENAIKKLENTRNSPRKSRGTRDKDQNCHWKKARKIANATEKPQADKKTKSSKGPSRESEKESFL